MLRQFGYHKDAIRICIYLETFYERGFDLMSPETICNYASILMELGEYYLLDNRNNDAIDNYVKAESLFKQLANVQGICAAVEHQAAVHLIQNRHERALQQYRELEDLYRNENLFEGVARSIFNQGKVLAAKNDYRIARTMFRTSEQMWRKLNNHKELSVVLLNHAITCTQNALFDDAIGLYREAEDLATRIGDKHRLADIYRHWAVIYYKTDDTNTAIDLLSRCIVFYEDCGDRRESHKHSTLLPRWCSNMVNF